jgi:hypothetical protein
VKGETIRQIAEAMNLSIGTVHKGLTQAWENWRATHVNDLEQWWLLELAKLDHIEHEVWEAWEQSKTDRVVHLQVVNPRTKAVRRLIIKSEMRCGDPRFLEIVGRCIERRCRLLGLFDHLPAHNDSADVDRETLMEFADDPVARELAHRLLERVATDTPGPVPDLDPGDDGRRSGKRR